MLAALCIRPGHEAKVTKTAAVELMRSLWSMGEEEVKDGETDFAHTVEVTKKNNKETNDTLFDIDV